MTFAGNFMCTSFKVELMEAEHNFLLATGDTFKIALYTNAGVARDATTTGYIVTDEVVGTAYVAGGGTLTRVNPTSTGTTAFTDFADQVWSTATITARGALIYNSTATGGVEGVVVLDFGSDQTSTAGDFTVQFPTPDSTSAIIRIA